MTNPPEDGKKQLLVMCVTSLILFVVLPCSPGANAFVARDNWLAIDSIKIEIFLAVLQRRCSTGIKKKYKLSEASAMLKNQILGAPLQTHHFTPTVILRQINCRGNRDTVSH